jgi:hypothetical protein
MSDSGGLPRYLPARRRDLIRFDLSRGLWVALQVLRERLGPLTTLRVLMRYSLASLHDPLAALPLDDWPHAREVMVRHQLRSAIWLDDALTAIIPDAPTRLATLTAVISQTGGTFIERMLPLPSLSSWEHAPLDARLRFMEEATGRFFNAEISATYADGPGLGFDVSRCRFVELAHAVGRPHLVPMFCQADAIFFSSPSSPVHLDRPQTLATGAPTCAFRFHYAVFEPHPPRPPSPQNVGA